MVITQGADPVIVVQNGEVTLYDVTKLAADKIVDTNGAGNYCFFQYSCIRFLHKIKITFSQILVIRQ